jgi:hypothetical protein
LGGLNPTVQHERKKEPQSSVRKKTWYDAVTKTSAPASRYSLWTCKNQITSHHIQCLSQLSTCPWHKPPASCRGLIPLHYNAVHNIKASWRNGSSVSGSSPHHPVDNKSTNKILWSDSIASGLTLWTNYIGERTGVRLS